MPNANSDKWWPLYCIDLYIQLHNPQLRPDAQGQVFDNWFGQVLESEEKELDTETSKSWATDINN